MKRKRFDTTQGAQGRSEERRKGASFCPHTGLHAPSGKETTRGALNSPAEKRTPGHTRAHAGHVLSVCSTQEEEEPSKRPLCGHRTCLMTEK